MIVQELIDKRKAEWNRRKDIEFDRKLTEAIARKILSTPELSKEIREKPYLLIEAVFTIVDKKRKTVPFFLNDVQKDFVKRIEKGDRSRPFFILKGRQQGFTSVISAIQLSYAIVMKNFSGFTMADRSDNTAAIFNDKCRTTYDRLPDLLKPHEKFNSRNEMFFDKLNSSWRIATATDQVGRSRTLNFVHFSEVAFFECRLDLIQAGIGEAITDNAIQIYETTANGYNQAKDLWDSRSCENIFYPWWMTKEYRSDEYGYLETDDGWLIERKKVLAEIGCDREQITWYCKKYHGYLDKTLIRQEYPITAEEAFVASGYSIFDIEKISNQMAVASTRKDKVGQFTYEKTCETIKNSEGKVVDVKWTISNIEFEERADGMITIHEDPSVKKRADGTLTHVAPYVIGGDTAGTGKDYFTAKVINNIDGKAAATLRKQRIDEDLYAEQLYCLGKYYHDALIGIEINYSREPMRKLVEYEYPNLYRRESIDVQFDEKTSDYGFLTTSKTKTIILAELVARMREDSSIERDLETLKEMTTFVKKSNGSQEAIEGCHDDLVMCTAIAHFISRQQTHEWIPVIDEDEDPLKNFFSVGKGEDTFVNWEDF